MAIKPVKNEFSSYIKLGDKQFFVTVNENLCKFFVLDDRTNMKVFYGEPIKKQFIYGFDEDNNNIAILIENNSPPPEKFFPFVSNYYPIKTPLIIKGTSSNDKEDELNYFDAITFTGGIIDSLYSPGLMALDPENIFPENGTQAIKILPFDDYTYKNPFELYDKKGTLTYSVSFDGSDLFSGTLGKLSAMVRVEFETPQPLDIFEHFYVLIKNFISFCVGQSNIRFSKVEINRKIVNGENVGKYKKLGLCKVFDEYVDYADLAYHKVIPLRLFDANIIDALKLLADKKVAPLLDFLPSSNIGRRRVTYEDIKNLCTAMEFEFDKSKFLTQKQADIQG